VLHLGEDLGAQGEVEGGEERGRHSLSHIKRNSYRPLYQCNASQRHTISSPVPSMTAIVNSVSSIFWPTSIDKPTEEVMATDPSLPLAPSPSPHEIALQKAGEDVRSAEKPLACFQCYGYPGSVTTLPRRASRWSSL
jgi:hypothetical protein